MNSHREQNITEADSIDRDEVRRKVLATLVVLHARIQREEGRGPDLP